MLLGWMLLAGPLALAVVGLMPKVAASPVRVARLATLAADLTVASAATALVLLALFGPFATPAFGIAGIGFGVYLDALSGIVFLLVAFVGAVVVRYSRNYLDGDPRHGHFLQWLCLTLAAVLTLVVSGNMLQFTLAWIATSVGLHHLLLFYPERQAAQLAARKKFIVSRIGDICLIAALVLVHQAVGSLDFATIIAASRAMPQGAGDGTPITLIAVLLVVCAALKSAQFPFHGWLLEVMETPTPVSALLHAGIINAGGFLILRFADLFVHATAALELLAVVGGLTALFGSIVMLTQTSIKVSLAYSTIAQMGFMMMQCGLGAFSAALLHIVAHSLYKAHAFLSSGSVIDLARASWSPTPGGQLHASRLAMALAGMLAATIAVSAALGATLIEKPGVFALGAVVVMGLAHLVANSIDERPNSFVIGRAILTALVVALTYFGLQHGAEIVTHGALPPTQALRGPLDVAIVALIVVSFGVVTIAQSLLPHQVGAPRWQAFYAHVSNGLYVNTVMNRLILRVWPVSVINVSGVAGRSLAGQREPTTSNAPGGTP